MDIGRDGSFHGYPAQVWPTITPASQDYSDLKMNSTNGLDNGFNNGTIGTSFGGWESSNLWSDDRVSNTHKPGLYDTLFMNNMWSGIPCSDLLALADPAIAVTRCSGDGYDSIIGGGCVSIGRGIYDDNKVSVPSQSQDVGCVPDSPQNEHPNETRYLFDLNSIPILTEPELITSSPSQLPPVTPKPTRRAGQRGKLSSDIIYSTQDETTDQDVINLEQPELIIEQSQDDLEVDEDFEEGSSDDVDLKKTPEPKQRRRKCRTLEQSKLITEQSRGDVWQLEVDEDFVEGSSDGLDFKKTPQPKQRRRRRRKHRKVEQPKVITEQSQDDVRQLEVDEDFEEGSSDDLDLTKTPQPKQRRRKHRPKVVIEGQTKSANKRTTPKPDGSKGNKKYDATGTPTNKGTNEATDRTISRPVRKTCRRRINFGDEWDFEGSDFEFIFENQVLSPITPAKSETKKDAGNKCSKAKQKIDFSRSNIASRDNSSCSTSAGFKKDASGIRYESLEAYRSMIPKFPSTYKRKRTELRYTSITSWAKSSVWSPERLTLNGVNHQSYKNILGFGNLENIRKKRSKGIKRMRDLNALTRMIEGKQHTCMEALAADFGFNRAAKKRTKRNSTMSSSSYYNHWFLTNYIGLQSNFRWKNTYDMDALINQFENLGLKNQRVEQDQKALVPYLTRYQEKKALVPYTTRYRQKNSLVLYQQNRSLVPFEDSDYEEKSGKLRPKVELDDETDRVWRLLLEDINSQGIDGIDEDNSKYWEEERNVFSGRAASFIARMHLVQGDRRFSRWKGSVVDSVTGVFLTQNVSDHLSSSAFINLAARYPLKSKSSTEPLHEEKSSISVSEICQLDLEETTRWQDNSNLQPAQPHDSTTPQHTDSYEEKGVVNSNELESIGYSHEQNEGVSEDHITSEIRLPPKNCDIQKVNMLGAIEAEYIELREGRTSMHKKHDEKCVSQQSEISSESANQTTLETVSENSNIVSNQDINDNNCNVQKILGIENSLAEISEVIESNNIVENSTDTVHELIESNENENDNLQATVSGINKGSTLARKGQTRKGKKVKVDWDSLRKSAQVKKKRERTPDTLDSLDYEAVRCADVDEISDAIKDRGMNNMLAERIKEFLNRLVKDHGSIDLEWLRDVPPDKAKEYLLSFRGLGLKSVECVRLLTLHHLAFPVDTNVGRIAVRLGWVPLQPLPESLQLHLLELYPILETIQKYLWPRLCKLDQKTLYELHYQMITFGKVFCTKNKPNCNSCPMRGECRHFASAFASARLSLPATEEKSIVTGTENRTHGQTPTWTTNQPHLSLPPPDDYLQQESGIQNHDPFVEEPTTPEPIVEVPATPELEQTQQEFDIEDFGEDPEEIPTITLNMEAFTQNLQTYMENNMELADGDMSRALVALTSEAASIPTPKLKNVSQLRTEHQVYELPDSHPLLEGLDKREPDDPCSYLLAIWTPGETAESIQPPKGQCNSQESDTLCHKETCFWCNSMREANSQTVRGTLLIPCRTAMRGSFPLNGTYFQVNEVFADHDSSLNPINVPRSWLWNLPRRTVYFGTSIPTIFRGLTTEGIQYCFWRGFVCVRGFDQKTRAPRPLMARLHFPVSKLKRSRGKPDED